MKVDIDESGQDVSVSVDGSFEEVAVNIAQIVRVVYDQIKKANAEAGQYFHDGFIKMINDERIWQTDSLIPDMDATAAVFYVSGEETED